MTAWNDERTMAGEILGRLKQLQTATVDQALADELTALAAKASLGGGHQFQSSRRAIDEARASAWLAIQAVGKAVDDKENSKLSALWASAIDETEKWMSALE